VAAIVPNRDPTTTEERFVGRWFPDGFGSTRNGCFWYSGIGLEGAGGGKMDLENTGRSANPMVSIRKLHDPCGDKAFWSTQPPSVRLEAMVFLRRQYFESRQESEPGLQRVLNRVARGKN
jgi:hypothetical protein